jgi:hypothetical protein
MRLSLGMKITAALVLFGIIPAATITYFIYDAVADFKAKQTILVTEAAAAASERITIYLLKKQGKFPVEWSSEPDDRAAVNDIFNKVAEQFAIPTADMQVVDSRKSILMKRDLNGIIDQPTSRRLPTRYDLAFDRITNGMSPGLIEGGRGFLTVKAQGADPTELVA